MIPSHDALPLFLAASVALIVAPGPDVLYVITRGMSQGRAAGLLSVLGVTLGLLVHTVMAALGLAFVLRTSALAFMTVKYLGAAYLIYLGVRALRQKGGLGRLSGPQSAGGRTIFVQGILTNVLNPKVALFFLAFLPQFVNPVNGPVALQMLSLGLLFALMGLAYLLVLALFAGSIGRRLMQNPRYASVVRRLSGGLLIALGLRLAFVSRE